MTCKEELVWGDVEHDWLPRGHLQTRGPGQPLGMSHSVLASASPCSLVPKEHSGYPLTHEDPLHIPYLMLCWWKINHFNYSYMIQYEIPGQTYRLKAFIKSHISHFWLPIDSRYTHTHTHLYAPALHLFNFDPPPPRPPVLPPSSGYQQRQRIRRYMSGSRSPPCTCSTQQTLH